MSWSLKLESRFRSPTENSCAHCPMPANTLPTREAALGRWQLAGRCTGSSAENAVDRLQRVAERGRRMLRVSVFATRDNPTAGSRRTIRKASFEDPVEEVPAPEPSQASSRAKAQLASAPPPRTCVCPFRGAESRHRRGPRLSCGSIARAFERKDESPRTAMLTDIFADLGGQIEAPFWELVSAPKWKNVDTDMKEAFDRRDNDERDPAVYAAHALESASGLFPITRGGPTVRRTGRTTTLIICRARIRCRLGSDCAQAHF